MEKGATKSSPGLNRMSTWIILVCAGAVLVGIIATPIALWIAGQYGGEEVDETVLVPLLPISPLPQGEVTSASKQRT